MFLRLGPPDANMVVATRGRTRVAEDEALAGLAGLAADAPRPSRYQKWWAALNEKARAGDPVAQLKVAKRKRHSNGGWEADQKAKADGGDPVARQKVEKRRRLTEKAKGGDPVAMQQVEKRNETSRRYVRRVRQKADGGDPVAMQQVENRKSSNRRRRQKELDAQIEQGRAMMAQTRTRSILSRDAAQKLVQDLLDRDIPELGGLSLRSWATSLSRIRRRAGKVRGRYSVYIGYTHQSCVLMECFRFLRANDTHSGPPLLWTDARGFVQRSSPPRPRFHVRQSEAEGEVHFLPVLMYKSHSRINARLIEGEMQRALHDLLNLGERLWRLPDVGVRRENDPSKRGNQNSAHKVFLTISDKVPELVRTGKLRINH